MMSEYVYYILETKHRRNGTYKGDRTKAEKYISDGKETNENDGMKQ